MEITLVTGGAGFVGAHLVAHLIRSGCEVLVVDDLSSGRTENFSLLGVKPRFIHADVSNPAALRSLSSHRVEMIYHLAAQASVPQSVAAPARDFEINVRGTLNVLEFAREYNAQVVFTSTVSVYAKDSPKPIRETAVIHASSPYGAAKIAGENYCFAYANCYGVRSVIARFFNVYGPLMTKYVIHDFVQKLKANPRKLTITGSGNQVRDYLYVEDAVRALVLLANKGRSGTAYNVGSGRGIRIIDLAGIIAEEMGLEGVELVCTKEEQVGDIREWYADISLLRQLGFEAKKSFREGIRETVHFLSGQGIGGDRRADPFPVCRLGGKVG